MATKKEYKYEAGDYRFNLNLNDDILQINVVNVRYCKEYATTLSECAKDFVEHPIIRNCTKLCQIIDMFFKGNQNVNMTWNVQCEQCESDIKTNEFLEIKLSAHTEFDDDSNFNIRLGYVEKALTMERVVDRMDLMAEDIRCEFREMNLNAREIDDIYERLDKLKHDVDEKYDINVNGIAELALSFEQIKNLVKTLSNDVVSMKNKSS